MRSECSKLVREVSTLGGRSAILVPSTLDDTRKQISNFNISLHYSECRSKCVGAYDLNGEFPYVAKRTTRELGFAFLIRELRATSVRKWYSLSFPNVFELV